MKRIAALGFIVLVSTGCLPHQLERYWEAKAQGGEVAAQADAMANAYLATKAEATAGRPCAQWYDLALDVGWTAEQWANPMARVMWGESNCRPDAYNRSGASGLMQVMPMWRDDCGGGDLFDPRFNLTCALHVLNVSSWQAWSAY